MRIIYALAISILITSCGQSYLKESLVPELENKFAKSYIDSITNGATDYCYEIIVPEYQNEQTLNYLGIFHSKLSNKKLINTNIIGYRITRMNDKKYINLEYEYEYDVDWTYFTVNLIKADGALEVQGFHMNQFKGDCSKKCVKK